jgi:hypothetical protein
MPCNIPDLFEIRGGKEATDAWGTQVAQTFKFMGVTDINFTPIEDSIMIADKRGSLQPGHESVKQLRTGTAQIDGNLSYQDAPYLFDGIFGTATPAADTDTYTYTYAGADGSCPNISFWTIAYGDTDDVYSLSGATIQSLNISGESGGPLTFSAQYIGKSIDTDTLDSDAEADRSVDFAMGWHVQLWIDPASDAAGTTEIANTGFAFSLDINTNREVVNHLGSLAPDAYREARPEGGLNLTLELTAATAAYIDGILAATTAVPEKVIRIKASSTTAGGIVEYIQVDFNGVNLESPQQWTDNDGVTSYDITFMGQYNSVLTNWIAVTVQNDISALP